MPAFAASRHYDAARRSPSTCWRPERSDGNHRVRGGRSAAREPAGDFGTTEARAGLSITVFALGRDLGAPVMPLLTLPTSAPGHAGARVGGVCMAPSWAPRSPTALRCCWLPGSWRLSRPVPSGARRGGRHRSGRTAAQVDRARVVLGRRDARQRRRRTALGSRVPPGSSGGAARSGSWLRSRHSRPSPWREGCPPSPARRGAGSVRSELSALRSVACGWCLPSALP